GPSFVIGTSFRAVRSGTGGTRRSCFPGRRTRPTADTEGDAARSAATHRSAHTGRPRARTPWRGPPETWGASGTRGSCGTEGSRRLQERKLQIPPLARLLLGEEQGSLGLLEAGGVAAEPRHCDSAADLPERRADHSLGGLAPLLRGAQQIRPLGFVPLDRGEQEIPVAGQRCLLGADQVEPGQALFKLHPLDP